MDDDLDEAWNSSKSGVPLLWFQLLRISDIHAEYQFFRVNAQPVIFDVVDTLV
ncbi:hypothetical protein D3C71_1869020 [compost metagenome]